MFGDLTRRAATRWPARNESGVIAIMLAMSMTLLLVAAAMALDFGLVRADRQVNKSAADSATLAGLQGLSNGDGLPHPYAGVCAAIGYLQKNGSPFAGVSGNSGLWTDGNGTATLNGCTTPTLANATCRDGVKSSWARFTWNGTWQGTALVVTIQSGYVLPDPAFVEDTLASATMDQSDDHQGCHQLAVIIRQNRKPAFGSLATSSDLVSTIRSVGRVYTPPAGYAPAMLLLKRSGCPVLQTGSSSGDSHIFVLGSAASNGLTQPGTIHSDSDGSGCSGSSNANIYLGRADSGIVTFAAPLLDASGLPTGQPDPGKPGLISSLAANLGASTGVIRDALANVYGSSAVDVAGSATATKSEVIGRSLVSRKPVDERYLPGVRALVTNAQSSIFGFLTASNAIANGYVLLSDLTASNPCKPTPAEITALNLVPTSKLFVDCSTNAGFVGPATFDAGTVVFSGVVAPAGTVALPNATKVYVFGAPGKDALDIGSGTFSVHTAGNLQGSPSQCSAAESTRKAILVLKAGGVKESTGSLQLCYTTMVAMGNRGDACLPASVGTAPTATPCNGGPGDGQLSQTGGNVDWTAPNQHDIMMNLSGNADPAKAIAWRDPNGPEDLAYWSESFGGNSNPTYNMNGGGTLHIVGVYMVPNADPFTIGGGASQTMTNAQYIASSIALNGQGTQIYMGVDPNSAVPLPSLKSVGLVR